jgi:glycosyltransferase involved in cell wall biosynthesis
MGVDQNASYAWVIPLRILVVATQIEIPGTGGGQTHVMELVSHLRERGEVLALTRRGSTGVGVLGAGVLAGLPPKGLSHVFSAVNLARSWEQVRKFAPNVIYERGSSFGLGAMYSRLLDVPMLTMLLDEHMSPLSLRRAQHIITTNPKLVPSRFRNKAVKVSWGANTQRFKPGLDGAAWRHKLGLSATDCVVGYCGTFRPWHGLDVLLDVAASCAPDTKFLMVGPLERAAWFIALVKERCLHERFLFTDAVPYEDVPSVLSSTDVCVAPFDPSQHKGAGDGKEYTLDPLKVFEYLALEKPVVTINSKNIAELFSDGVHLKLVPPRDPAALLQAISYLRSNPEAARELAAAGRKQVELHHTWRAHAEHLARLFRGMLAPIH